MASCGVPPDREVCVPDVRGPRVHAVTPGSEASMAVNGSVFIAYAIYGKEEEKERRENRRRDA